MATLLDQQSGFPFPMVTRDGLKGPLTYVSKNTVELIKASIKQILLTTPGERMWNPEFGSRLTLMIFDQVTPNLSEIIINEILEALERWEPRIVVRPQDIQVVITPDIGSSIEIRINFKVKNPDFTTDADTTVIIVL